MAKVSIIIPLYNDCEYLTKSLQSVRKQTLEDIEIICVDDCSQDDTFNVLNNIAINDSRIHIVRHEVNMGTSQSRKDGVMISSGDCIMFLDGDDELVSNACQKAYDAISKNGVDIVHFGTHINNCGNMTEKRIQNNEKALAPFVGKITDKPNLVKQCFEYHKFGSNLLNKAYKGDLCRKAFQHVERGKFTKGEDWYAFAIIAYYASSYLGIQDDLYIYNFGLGGTGGDVITLNQYLPLLGERNTYQAIERFFMGKPDSERYKTILEQLYDHFLGECVYKWKNQLISFDQKKGFDELVKAWGSKVVLLFLAEHFWYNIPSIGNLLVGTKTFKYAKRDNSGKITVAAYYRSIAGGGAQRVAALLSNRWSEIKDSEGNYLFNVVLITDDGPVENEYELSPRVARAYLPSFLASRQKNYKQRYEAWQDIISEYRIDVVVDGLWVDNCTFWDVLSVKSHPSHPAFIVHSHNFCAVPFHFSTDVSYMVSTMYRLCDGVAALSSCDKLYISSFAKRCKFILNPLTFNPSELPLSKYTPKMIVWVGRISWEKHPLDAIKMMVEVRKTIPDAKLYIVGGGDKNILSLMEKMVKQLGLSRNVIFTGFTLDVAKFYSLASCFICTSEFEGFPMTLGEALSYGLPIITYTMDWLTFTQDGRGIISVPQGDYAKMAEKVTYILLHPDRMKQIGKEGKQLIEEIGSADIDSDWGSFFREINEDPVTQYSDDEKSEQIVLKNLTHYQNIGKQRHANNMIKSANQRMNGSLGVLDKQYKDLSNAFNAMKGSRSYKIGRLVTFIPRKVKGGRKCYKEHGLTYTLRRTLWHLGFISSWKE